MSARVPLALLLFFAGSSHAYVQTFSSLARVRAAHSRQVRGALGLRAEVAKNGVASKIALVALGCPKNTVDAEVMLGDLKKRGFDIVRRPRGFNAPSSPPATHFVQMRM